MPTPSLQPPHHTLSLASGGHDDQDKRATPPECQLKAKDTVSRIEIGETLPLPSTSTYPLAEMPVLGCI